MKILKFFIVLIFISQSSLAQKNVVLIIADDIGSDYFGFNDHGIDTVNVPQIRSLVANGIVFKNAWAFPVCSPTRATIFTGRYPFRHGVGGVVGTNNNAEIDTAEITLAKILKSKNIATANIGKWHLNTYNYNKRFYPNLMGYNFYSGNFSGAINNYYNWVRVRNGVQDTVTDYATTVVVNDAIDWLDTVPNNQSFFLWLAFNAPHSPYHVPPSNLYSPPVLSGTDISTQPKKYFKAMMESLDTEVGRLILYLKNNNLYDSTTFIFIGDNGNTNTTSQNAQTNKAKGTLYNYGVHVPMVISGPTVLSGNRTSQGLVSIVDLHATILELFNTSNSLGQDSKSLNPIIKFQTDSIRPWIFSEFFQNVTDGNAGKSIRNHRYHLIRKDIGGELFFDLQNDPLEDSNILNSNLSPEAISSYHYLCSELNNLLGQGSCSPVSIEDVRSEIWSWDAAHNIIRFHQQDIVDQIILYDPQGRILLQSAARDFIDCNIFQHMQLHIVIKLKSGKISSKSVFVN